MTTPEREKVRQKKLTCTQKTASREIFSYSIKTSQENRFQAPELHQGNRLTTTKIASGIPYWLGRDPIEEQGGLNIYSFVSNRSINSWDNLGMFSGAGGAYWPVPGNPNYPPSPTPSPGGGGGGASLPSLNVSASGGIDVSGCGIYGPGVGAKICLGGSISVELGSCCDTSTNEEKLLTKFSGSLTVSGGVAAGALGGISVSGNGTINVGALGDCPADASDNTSIEICVQANGGFAQGSCCWTPDGGWSCSGGFQVTSDLSVTVSGTARYDAEFVSSAN